MNLEYAKPMKEVVALRHSVRSYEEAPIAAETLEKIETYIKEASNPFHKNVRIKLIKKDEMNKDLKLGTYGVIKGAKYFLLTACEPDALSYTALGYTLEKVILYCTSLGLGTVWLGGTFQKGEFAKAMELKGQEVLPIVAPVGYEGGKKSFLGKMFGNHSSQRKPFEELFFDETANTPLQEANAGIYQEPLELLRLAPSAVNKQPWRAGKDGENVHFYLASEKGLTHVDLGIGLCHFHLSAKEKGIDGRFAVENDRKKNTDKGYQYQISWIKE